MLFSASARSTVAAASFAATLAATVFYIMVSRAKESDDDNRKNYDADDVHIQKTICVNSAAK